MSLEQPLLQGWPRGCGLTAPTSPPLTPHPSPPPSPLMVRYIYIVYGKFVHGTPYYIISEKGHIYTSIQGMSHCEVRESEVTLCSYITCNQALPIGYSQLPPTPTMLGRVPCASLSHYHSHISSSGCSQIWAVHLP